MSKKKDMKRKKRKKHEGLSLLDKALLLALWESLAEVSLKELYQSSKMVAFLGLCRCTCILRKEQDARSWGSSYKALA